MNASKILTGILNISYILLIFGWSALFIFLIYTISGGGIEYPLNNFSQNLIVHSKNDLITTIIYFLFKYGFMIYLVYLVRKLVDNLITGPLFTRYQVAGFNLIGQLIIWFIVINALAEFILKMALKARIEVVASFPDFWLFVALGAFFIFLGKIFRDAEKLKEENDLTI